jgi:hypothetical protein
LASALVSGVVPPTAAAIQILASDNYKNSSGDVLAAPNTSWGGSNNGPAGSNGQIWPIYMFSSIGSQNQSAWLALEGTAVAWASNGAGGAISCLGWEDNI